MGSALKLILAFLVLTVSCTTAVAQSSVWAVRAGDEVVYLGGTIHVLRPSDYPLPREFDAAYAASDELLLETDVSRLRDPEVQEMMRSKLRYQDGRTLAGVLSPEAYNALRKCSETMGVSLPRFEAFQPPMVLLALLAVELERLGVSASGVDEHFHMKALADHKQVGSLETVESQMDFLSAIGEGQESSFVIQSLEELNETGAVLEDAIRAWRLGDAEHLAALLVESTKRRYPGLYRALVVERNHAWYSEIEKLFTRPGREFVLVGVGHLVGEEGLLQQFEQAGYEVRQFKVGGTKGILCQERCRQTHSGVP